jgi:hypothetical protein
VDIRRAPDRPNDISDNVQAFKREEIRSGVLSLSRTLDARQSIELLALTRLAERTLLILDDVSTADDHGPLAATIRNYESLPYLLLVGEEFSWAMTSP